MVSDAPATLKLSEPHCVDKAALTSCVDKAGSVAESRGVFERNPNSTESDARTMSEALALMPWPRRVTRTETPLELSAPRVDRRLARRAHVAPRASGQRG